MTLDFKEFKRFLDIKSFPAEPPSTRSASERARFVLPRRLKEQGLNIRICRIAAEWQPNANGSNVLSLLLYFWEANLMIYLFNTSRNVSIASGSEPSQNTKVRWFQFSLLSTEPKHAYHLINLHDSPTNSNITPCGWNFALSTFRLRPYFWPAVFFSAYQESSTQSLGVQALLFCCCFKYKCFNWLTQHWPKPDTYASANTSGPLVPNEFVVGDISQRLLRFHLRSNTTCQLRKLAAEV